MEGTTLIHQIPESAFVLPDIETLEFTVAEYQEGLTLQLLASLYEAEIPFKSNVEPLLKVTSESLMLSQGMKKVIAEQIPRPRPQIVKVGRQMIINHVNLDKPLVRKPDDSTGDLTSAEMLPTSHAGVDTMRDYGASFSNQLLATAINQVAKSSDRLDKGKTTVSKEVGQALRQRRQDFVRQFDRFGSTTTITRTRKTTGELISMESNTRAWTVRNHVPDWLQGQEAWDEALHMLCSHFTELDTFVAAYEWSIDRNLPVIPILAPSVVDNDINKMEDGKLNSDVLLLNLAKNVIIPIQAKTTASTDKKQDYSSEVILVDPKMLGCVDVDTAPIKVNGTAQTGIVSKTHHGALMTEFMRVYNPGSKGRKQQNSRIKMAFDFYDREVLPRLGL